MSNIIQIKHGENEPGNGILAPYELGYAISKGILYIGIEDTDDTDKNKVIPLNYLPSSDGTVSDKVTFKEKVTFNNEISVSGTSNFNGQAKFNNILIVDSNSFGPTLPSNGVDGQLFFKTV